MSLSRVCMLSLLGYMAIILCACDSSNKEHGAASIIAAQNSSTSTGDRFGMIYIEAPEGPVILGTNDSTAPAREQPSMKVELTYNFYIGKSEVTRREFKKLLDSVAVPSNWRPITSIPMDSLNYPMTNVSYYDAVLYANARSKYEHWDTVYTYKSVSFDENGTCKSIEGLVFNPEINGYRLPTEAEWVLAANRSWKPSDGWNADNSNRKLHWVCTAEDVSQMDSTQRDSALCDMAGNALEWVNDWMGEFRDTALTNYVGASSGGSLGERVVKGGSFNDYAKSMKLYSRGDIYTVTSSSRSNYVGFRLAFGSIPDAIWLNSDGSVTESRIDILTRASTLGSTLGTNKIKLAFRNDLTGNLAYVDFSTGGSNAIEINGNIDVYHPEISPDGKWVAFCTKLEGVSGKSEVYVRHLDPSGSNLKKLNVESAAIPRWRVLDNGDTVIVFVTDAGNNKEKTAFASTSTWQVKFANFKFGTPEKLFDGAYHGGISGDDRLAVSGARLLRARIAEKNSTLMEQARDTIWYNEEQACNASLSRDESKRTLFLDFGGKAGKTFTGKSYGTHEMLLVADSTGQLVQGIPAPSGTSFDHSEWVLRTKNSPEESSDGVVATLVNENGAHTKIVLVNLKDSSITEIAAGMELWHPSLWVYGSARNEKADLDSAGVYYDSESDYENKSSAVELAYKMSEFWKVYKDVEYVAFGSSMTLNALIADSVKTFKTLNMSYTLGDIFGFMYVIKNYVLPYASSLKVLSVELSPAFLFHESDSMWNEIYENAPGFMYDENHIAGQFDAIVENSKQQEFTKEMFSSEYLEGTFLLPSKEWGEPIMYSDILWMYTSNGHYQINFDMFVGLRDNLEKQGIKFFVNITPRNPRYKETEAFDYFGPRWNVAEKVISMFEEEKFLIFDENKNGDHDYTDDMAYNTVHLSKEGARRYTERLDSLLETLK